MAQRRRRRPWRIALVLLVTLGLTIAAVNVVQSLVRLPSPPLVQRCLATDGSTSVALDPEQAAYAALISAIATERGLPARAVTIGLATAMQESRLANLDYGDRDSLGLFQQRPSQGWGTVEQVTDPVHATNAFYDALVRVPDYERLEVTVAAQEVQRSGFPDAYAQHEQLARLFASALTGHSPASVVCRLAEPDPATTAALPAMLSTRLARDLPSVSMVAAEADQLLGVEALVPDGGADSRDRLAWAVAQWAVATAHETGVSEVVVAGQRWVRSEGARAAWAPLPEGAVGADDPAGTVRVR
ncbi:hypothetical protein EXU48_10420 [Occultella glacieicola]|uniref:Uncharacterized protein n=1 Tax=Occultella glacieicola TaxID=2518684 RepID=A0ABY2E2N2_9MICO|nr:hypothetical protein [Occultella glacieicola]TDE93884.1 hypothetical protein EXU48_10420 [Occultella glacieicola]